MTVNGNRTLRITAEGLGPESYYVQSVKVNGKEWKKNWVGHEDVMVEGGTVEFLLGGEARVWEDDGVEGRPGSPGHLMLGKRCGVGSPCACRPQHPWKWDRGTRGARTADPLDISTPSLSLHVNNFKSINTRRSGPSGLNASDALSRISRRLEPNKEAKDSLTRTYIHTIVPFDQHIHNDTLPLLNISACSSIVRGMQTFCIITPSFRRFAIPLAVLP